MKHEPSVYLWYNDTWNDHTSDAREKDPISIRWGKQDETSAPVPNQLSMSFDNRALKYDPDDPMSLLYGSIGRNTPIQVGFDAVTEDYEDTTYAFTWITYGSASWARSSAQAYAGSWSLKSGALSDGQESDMQIQGLDTNRINTIEFRYWTDISSSSFFAVYNQDGLVWYTTGNSGGWQRIALEVGPGSIFTFSYQRNSSSGTNAVYIDQVRIINARFTGEVAKWTPESTDDFNPTTGRGDAWTKVTAGGLLRRLNQNAEELHSPIYRVVQYGGVTPAYYWPMEDASGSSQAAAWDGGAPMVPITFVRYTLPGGAPLPPGGAPEFARGAGVPGSSSLVSFTQGGTLSAHIADVGFSGYAIDWVMKFAPGSDVTGTGSADILHWTESGTYVTFTVNVTNTSVTVFHANRTDAATLASTGSAVASLNPYDGAPHHYRYQVRQSGGSYLAELYVDGLLYDTAENFATGMAGTVGHPEFIEWNPLEDRGDYMPTEAGHLIVWASGASGGQPAVFDAVAGYISEESDARLDRMAGEEGFQVVVEGRSVGTSAMGVQPAATLAANLAEIERAEDAMLVDMRGAVALHYRPKHTMYLRDPDLTVAYGVGVQALKPISDDQATRNDVTAKNADGTQARSVVATGPLSVADVGRYPATYDINIDTASASVQERADWESRKGTVPGKRYPAIVIDYDADPTLGAAAQNLRPGDRLVLTGASYDDVNLRVLGGTETIGTHRYMLSLNCGSGRQWLPAELDGTVRRLDSRYTTLKSGVNSSATSMTFRFPALEGQWSTASTPYDVIVSGERITVTSMGSASLVSGAYDQVATVTRSVNGVVKSLSAGEEIHVFEPARLALR